MFGSNAKAEAGIFGRVDAVYTSIESQQSTGSLHANSQVVVQRLHQHTSLSDMHQQLRKQPGYIIKSYLNDKTHVIRQLYELDSEELQSELEAHEKAWLEYKDSRFLNQFPHIYIRRHARLSLVNRNNAKPRCMKKGRRGCTSICMKMLKKCR